MSDARFGANKADPKHMKNRKKSILIALATLALAASIAVPASALIAGKSLSKTLTDMRRELRDDYLSRKEFQVRMQKRNEEQHLKMVNVIKECNELSLLLYSQKSQFTFDMAFALREVTRQYKEFNQDRRPYDVLVDYYDVEIDRYARLLETLRRLPPERDELVDIVPDSLRYHNDTLDHHISQTESYLERELEAIVKAVSDSTIPPFMLDEAGETDRDSCIFYASELLKINADNKAKLVADSTHYREAHLRIKESYDYAQGCYESLKNTIFIEGQTTWWKILSTPERYWRSARRDTKAQYSWKEFKLRNAVRKGEVDPSTVEITDKADNMLNVLTLGAQILVMFAYWIAARILLALIMLIFKPLRRKIAKQQRPWVALIIGLVAYMLTFATNHFENIYIQHAFSLAGTFFWLLAAIVLAMLIRLKPEQLKSGLRVYLPNIFMALFVIGCRISFVPNNLLNFIFPPILLVIFIWQLVASIVNGRKSDKIDNSVCWFSLMVDGISFIIAASGYNFLALMVLVWWYFQLAAIQTLAAFWNIITHYRDNRVRDRVERRKAKLVSMAGVDYNTVMFGATWFYELVKDVVIPGLALMSVPMCIKMALGVFDFDEMFHSFYYGDFVSLTSKEGVQTFHASVHSVIVLIATFFAFRYLARAMRAIYQKGKYEAFMRKNHRTSVRSNELNLSLGTSLINVLSWMTYIVFVVVTLGIPTGSLSIVAGGLSAGVGLAMKDILNNFIYGIQLMSGRLRVGDWIICDDVRGQVTAIGYQSTQVETLDGTTINFLNASLFSKSFTNLTKSNSYEFLKILVSVAYGTDFQKVREVIVESMQQLRTKDGYGREIVEPSKGIYVVFGDFLDSGVEVAVKQFVLVPERIGYMDRAKEIIYKALNDNGITIPFPQCDVHMIEDK